MAGRNRRRLRRAGTTLAAAAGSMMAFGVQAGTLSQTPLYVGAAENLPPLVMLAMSNDHQLYFKAYSDYSDLDGDGQPETTYTDSFDYYGYFDSGECYTYSSGVFVSAGSASGANDHYCNEGAASGQWSGNFLNWATMARIDVVRKLLYGGYRSTDTGTETVLERTYLPNDSHSWAKYYNGADIASLTPFTGVINAAPEGTSDDTLTVGTGNITFEVSPPGGMGDEWIQYGDQLVIEEDVIGTPSRRMYAVVGGYDGATNEVTVHVGETEGGGSAGDWIVRNPTRTGLTVCNTTLADGEVSQNVDTGTHPPLARVVSGNYSLWNANERWQCRLHGERRSTRTIAGGFDFTNSNQYASSGLFASADTPEAALQLGDGDYNVRVRVCESATAEDNCKTYPDGNTKPTGILQDYGDEEDVHFGLINGSYKRNKSGGLLRKNIEAFTDEINATTDGTFTNNFGIVEALDLLRIHGYNHGGGSGNGRYNSTDDCPWALSSFSDGDCSNWGNPISEIYLEAVRYFAVDSGRGPSPEFTDGNNDEDYISGLDDVSWDDPMTPTNYCSKLDIVAFNASGSSYDHDQYSSVADIDAAGSVNPTSTADVQDLTDAIGAEEGINGGDYFVGEAGAADNGLCTAKNVGALGDVLGICPQPPRLKGTYHMAGLARFAHEQDIRDGYGLTPHVDQNVDTYGVELAAGLPQLQIPVPGESKTVTLIPACRNDSIGGNCALVDFKIVAQDQAAGTGRFFVQWEDSEQGGDYDQDMAGAISYEFDTTAGLTKLDVTTQAFTQSTPDAMGFGYVINGTSQDGFHAHSGINGFDHTDATGVTGCSNCRNSDGATTHTYTIASTSDADILNRPLWYAAKWGGYKDNEEPGEPGYGELDDDAEWDSDGDGVPDNYHYAIDPRKLAESLGKIFSSIVTNRSSSAPLANNTGIATQTETRLYQPIFKSSKWYGELLAYSIGSNGNLADSPDWDAGEELADLSWDTEREILTYNPAVDGSGNVIGGVPFRWDELSDDQKDALDFNPETSSSDSKGQDRLRYLRGARGSELQKGGTMRNRVTDDGVVRLLGDIVNSAPYYVGAPPYSFWGLPGDEGTKYNTFVDNHRNRQGVVYVGANDGMLHGFNAETGREMLAFVPDGVMDNLSELTSPSYQHRYYVDGSPTVVDAYFDDSGGEWKTVLVAGLGAGGKSVFALDVTNPGSFDEANADDLVLWEFSHADLGHTMSRPAIIRMHNGEWAAVFSSGYNHSSGPAHIFIVDIEDGSLMVPPIEVPDDGVSTLNGIATLAPADVETDGQLDNIVDYLYFGDLHGRLWKYDVRDSNANQWDWAYKQGNTPKPLFVAKDGDGDVQPVTIRPEASRHPTNVGHLLHFGTGRYHEVGDNVVSNDPQTQTFYGVWDTHDYDAGDLPLTRSDLVTQEVTTQLSADGANWRLTTQNAVRWNDDAGDVVDHGWLVDLPTDGERVITTPVVRDTRVLFTTLIPLEDPCQFGGTGWFMELDARNGWPLPESPFDVNQDQIFSGGDLLDHDGDKHVASGTQSQIGIPAAPTVLAGSSGPECAGGECKYLSGSSGKVQKIDNNTGASQGRQTWRELR